MKYESIIKGIFIDRPNRFIAHVSIELNDGTKQTVTCHVKNTGRCRELLLPGVSVLLQHHIDAAIKGRKTEYSLVGVWKDRWITQKPPLLINMDSQAPNAAAFEWLQTFGPSHGITNIRREVRYDQSRFDLAFDIPEENRQAFMEVKGVTLEDCGIASFPDAPTERGVKHVMELIKAAQNDYYACILFVIQMKDMSRFRPNWKTHPEFGYALQKAAESGVHLLAYDCIVTDHEMIIDAPVPIDLAGPLI